MTQKRFNCTERGFVIDYESQEKVLNLYDVVDKLNNFQEENEQLRLQLDLTGKQRDEFFSGARENANLIKELQEENKRLQKQIHLIHMASMFSTVKSFSGDVSKRYRYSEETDTIYDTANNYGSYDKILNKKEITMLLNEYNTLLEGDK